MYVMFNFINLYVAIHDVTVFIIKVSVLMHEYVHSCLHLSIVNKMLFIPLFYVYVYFIYNHYVLTRNPLPNPLPYELHTQLCHRLIYNIYFVHLIKKYSFSNKYSTIMNNFNSCNIHH